MTVRLQREAEMVKTTQSLRRRLPAWIAVIVAVAVVAFGSVAYVAVRQESERVMWVRLRSVADRFASVTGPGVLSRVAAVREIAARPRVAALLAGRGDTAAVRTLLAALGPDTGLTLAVGLRKADGSVTLSLGRPLVARPADVLNSRDSPYVSRLYLLEGEQVFETAAPVKSHGAVVGQVVVVRSVLAGPDALKLLNELLGPRGRMLVGNADGSQWTNFVKPLGPLEIPTGRGSFVDNGEARMVYASPIANSPLLFAVSVPRAELLAPVRGMLWTLVGLGGVVVAFGALAGWFVIRRVTSPLVQLTDAAECIAAGTRATESLPVGGDDEVGRLGEAFVVMANSVRAARERLEQQVAERTEQLQLAQGELIQREKMAVLGQLASSVGHELRNPLGVMSNVAYYLSHAVPDLPPKARDHLATLRRQIGIAERIVSDILDFTRIKEPQRESVAVGPFIDDQLQRMTASSTVRIEREISDDVPEAMADPFQVGQVLFNVLTNAVQSMEPVGGTVTVRAYGKNGRVQIDVADEGIGISESAREKVFEPLYTTKMRGIGLGLSVSRTLARANGGELLIAGSGPRGTTFRLELPTARSL
ncbi:MAG: ATP-binding protein [Gemmatimonadota bacterium]